MGYTHYWRRPQTLDASKFKLAVDDCKKICDTLPVPLGDYAGRGQATEGGPEFTDDVLCFNGSITSHSLCKADISIPWPTENAEGIAIVADAEPIAGRWFAGDTLLSRCCDENGDGSYETFCIPRILEDREWQTPENGLYFECCKTGFRPYDLNVQCCLIVFKEYFGDSILVFSDGTDKQWNEARDVCQHVLGYGLLFSLSLD